GRVHALRQQVPPLDGRPAHGPVARPPGPLLHPRARDRRRAPGPQHRHGRRGQTAPGRHPPRGVGLHLHVPHRAQRRHLRGVLRGPRADHRPDLRTPDPAGVPGHGRHLAAVQLRHQQRRRRSDRPHGRRADLSRRQQHRVSGRQMSSTTPAASVLDTTRTGSEALLDVRGVSLNFGGINALSNIDLSVREREIFALIGPKGAGKSTLFNCITRLYKPTEGSITFAGHDLLALQAHDLPAIGIARTFQNTALFPQLSVLDNVLVGAHHATDHSPVRAVLRTSSWRRNETEVRERAEKLLVSLSLDSMARRRLGSLDFPTQKRVELARALLASPRLLLLDEPAGGLAREEAEELSLLVRKLRDEEDLTV